MTLLTTSPSSAAPSATPAQLAPGLLLSRLRLWATPTTWPWPLPALAAWVLGWCAWRAALALGMGTVLSLAAGCLVALMLAAGCSSLWRRAIAALGFPLVVWAGGAAQGLAALAWLLPLVLLLVAYPLRAWRDAPFFPTPVDGLQGLPEVVGQPTRVLDAGCGLGHGLRALAAVWPQATLYGVEWSPLLTLGARLRAPKARIRRGDMWQRSWAIYDLVYLFQRPESMARAWEKARRELKPGAWLVSLEFPVPGVEPLARLQGAGRRTVWVYRT